jgi:ferrous iron transport protein B
MTIIFKYDSPIEHEINQLSRAIEAIPALAQSYNPRWLAIQLLEEDELLLDEIESIEEGQPILEALDISRERLKAKYDDDVDVMLAENRYGFVHEVVNNVLVRNHEELFTLSDKIDKIITHRLLGIPIFFAVMWVVFKITADLSAPYLDWVEFVISSPITNWTVTLLSVLGASGSWIESLLVDGVIVGVGGVLVFVPVLMSLYLALAILEDSGYMARAAFVMDRPMRAIGLPGKSFLPMIVGFGCTVPAYYATRILENKKDRILTGLLAHFMSCGARLPVYVLFATIFFPYNTGMVVFSMYALGIVMAIVLGFILNRTIFKDSEQSPLVMELPPYRIPTLKNVWMQMQNRTWSFVRKAWTVILTTSIIVWLLMAIPVGGDGRFADTDINNSAFASLSGVIAPIFRPMGTDSWQATGALITGFIAKEVIISTMAQTHVVEEVEVVPNSTSFIEDVGDIVIGFGTATWDTVKSIPLIVGINLLGEDEAQSTKLMSAIRASFEETSDGHGALAALAYLIFVLTYSPCMTALVAERQELGTKWMWFSIIGQTILAWVLGVFVFQSGVLLGVN